MKQHHLSTKFLRFYILIGILGFFLITLGAYSLSFILIPFSSLIQET